LVPPPGGGVPPKPIKVVLREKDGGKRRGKRPKRGLLRVKEIRTVFLEKRTGRIKRRVLPRRRGETTNPVTNSSELKSRKENALKREKKKRALKNSALDKKKKAA